jgi:SAM-dependent methyltransferase
LFFQRCLAAIPGYLRGSEAPLRFTAHDVCIWDDFLGCEEFRGCRSLLVELIGLRESRASRVLDLCYGPGWGIEAVLSRFPRTHITGLDFTDAFRERARARVERVQALNRQHGVSAMPVVWVGTESWKGFGHPLPFPEAAFDAVLFTCGDPYVPVDLRGEVYGEIARVLTRGGRLGILTRCSPDAGRRHVSSQWLRISALVHDFAESVCDGWAGFSEAEENIRLFSAAGFEEGTSHGMSALEASIWVLRKRDPHD